MIQSYLEKESDYQQHTEIHAPKVDHPEGLALHDDHALVPEADLDKLMDLNVDLCVRTKQDIYIWMWI